MATPEKLGKYSVTRELGKGAMGVVYEGRDPNINRVVALKTIRKDLLDKREISDVLARFKQEAQAAGSLNHPNIVGVYDYGEEDDTAFIAMEFLQGKELQDVLENQERFDIKQVVDIVMQLLSALDYAHQQGVVHRDIKPANIVITPDQKVKLTDFGIARIESSNLTQAGAVMGTPSYMSPEQCLGLKVDGRSDVFSVGVILYQMLTGEKPFSGNSITAIMHKVVHEQPSAPSLINILAPKPFDYITLKALAKRPEERYQTAREFAEDLRIAMEGEWDDNKTIVAGATLSTIRLQGGALGGGLPPAGGQPGGAPAGNPPDAGRRKLLAGVAGASVLALAGGVAIWQPWRKEDGPTGTDGSPGKKGNTFTGRGVAVDSITIGMTASFSGPTRDIGRALQTGVETAFKAVNEAGGVHGRTLQLVALDDKRDPAQGVKNVTDLLQRGVFCVVATQGTDVSQAVAKYLANQKTILFAPWTGAKGELRSEPPNRYVFHYRASYATEAAALVNHFIKLRGIKPEEIAVFAQGDGFGEAGYDGVVRALRANGYPNADQMLYVKYDRSKQSDISEALAEFMPKAKQIKAVIAPATAKPGAQLVTALQKAQPATLIGVLSASSGIAESLKELGWTPNDQLIITQVVPHFDSGATGVIRYREMLKKFYPTEAPGFTSLESYIAAMLLVEGIRKAGEKLDNEALANALESMKNVDLGTGAVVEYGPSDHEGSSQVWGTRIDNQGNYASSALE